MMKRVIPLLAAASMSLVACETVPSPKQALQMDLPSRYEASESATSIATASRSQWWSQLGDNQLDDLVQRGMSQNLDIRTALERVRQAEANAGQTGVLSWFSGNATALSTRTEGSGTNYVSSGIISQSGQTVSSASLGLSVLLDVFGKGTNTRKAALAQLQSAKLGVGAARLAYLSSLIGNYLDAQYNHQAIELTRENIKSGEETLDIVKKQRNLGAATDVDVVRAQATLESFQAALPNYETAYHAAIYSLATLLDTNANDIESNMQFRSLDFGNLPMPATGIPADLLRNLPGIRIAEENYVSAYAAVGVAKANMLPSITLNGSVRRSSGDTTWSYGPTVSLPIFNQPRLYEAHKAAISQAKQAELAWRSAVRTGVQNAQTALVRFNNSADALAAGEKLLDSNQQVVDVAKKTYGAGLSTLFTLLSDQRTLASGRISYAQAQRNYAANWVAVQIASGKGWEE